MHLSASLACLHPKAAAAMRGVQQKISMDSTWEQQHTAAVDKEHRLQTQAKALRAVVEKGEDDRLSQICENIRETHGNDELCAAIIARSGLGSPSAFHTALICGNVEAMGECSARVQPAGLLLQLPLLCLAAEAARVRTPAYPLVRHPRKLPH